MAKRPATNSGYQNAREMNFRRATTVRVFGVPTEKTTDGYVTILWCGIAVDGVENRQPTERIWHLPKADIVETGKADGGIQWFDLRKETTAVEESYSPVSLIHVARMRLGRRFGRLGSVGDVPVTIEPTSTTIPSSPPVTISP